MKMPFQRSAVSDRSSASLVATLAFAALVPVACVLWFMNAAMRNERLAVQERKAEVNPDHFGTLEHETDKLAMPSRRQGLPLIGADFLARHDDRGMFVGIAGADAHPDDIPLRKPHRSGFWRDIGTGELVQCDFAWRDLQRASRIHRDRPARRIRRNLDEPASPLHEHGLAGAQGAVRQSPKLGPGFGDSQRAHGAGLILRFALSSSPSVREVIERRAQDPGLHS